LQGVIPRNAAHALHCTSAFRAGAVMGSRRDLGTEATRSGAEQQSPARPTRVIYGSDGELWVVRELAAPAFDRRDTPSLVFSTDDVMRRVRNYPSNWFELSDEALFEVSLRY
jgi:hypothetical protein